MATRAHIFVYGSLVSQLRHPQGVRLAAEADRVGAATFAGRLYRVSWYPGVVDGTTSGEIVHGEVFYLKTPDATLAWLDEYEGISRGAMSVTTPDEYVREVRAVRLGDGRALDTWIYLFRGDTTRLARVNDGHWRG